MNKEQAKAIVRWVDAMDKTVQDISKHAQMNLDSRQQITNLIVQLGEATDVLTKEEVKKLKEI